VRRGVRAILPTHLGVTIGKRLEWKAHVDDIVPLSKPKHRGRCSRWLPALTWTPQWWSGPRNRKCHRVF
jgi:hypothetical protein